MKRTSDKHQRWLRRHAEFQNERRLRSLRRHRRRRREGQELAWLPRPATSTTTDAHLRIPVPEDLSLSRNFAAVMGFFETMRSAIASGQSIWIDFSSIRKASPAATLVLAAELDRWQQLRNMKLRPREVERWDRGVQRHFAELGLFELLGTEQPIDRDEAQPTSLRMIRFRTGQRSLGAVALELQDVMEAIAGPIEAANFLYAGITEAMTNVRHHAYPAGKYRVQPIAGQWWLGGSYDPAARKMKVLIYDQGIGIPASLPRSRAWERVRGFLVKKGLSASDDAAMIRAAVETGRSATLGIERGHGLDDIKRFVDESADGTLRILSGAGAFIYRRGKKPKFHRLQATLGGTLIDWEVTR